MGRKISAIETRYGLGDNFKLVIKMPIVVGSFTLIEVNCKEELSYLIVQNFKLEKLEHPWMDDPIGKCTKIIKENKKHLAFNHEAWLHIEFFTN